MPSEFEAMFDQCASPLIDDYDGEAIGYLPRGREDMLDMVGVWNPDDFLNPSPEPHGRVEKASGELWIRKVWFAKYEIDPKEGCDVSIKGQLYSSIGPIKDGGDGWYILTLSSKSYAEKSDGGLRRPRQ